ncbi:Uncharacterised protein [Mycobacteroides abscessus subsp. abscessus]|nr:Uncharacterised protein [Mycobacteroides abscessus subsp. abscessus]
MAVFVITRGIIEGNSFLILAVKSRFCLCVSGVHLNRQGGVNGKNLKEEREVLNSLGQNAVWSIFYHSVKTHFVPIDIDF